MTGGIDMYMVIPILTVIGLAVLVACVVLIVLYDRGLLSGKKKYFDENEHNEAMNEVQKIQHEDFISNMENTTQAQNRAAMDFKTTGSYEEKNTKNIQATELQYSEIEKYSSQQNLMRYQQRNSDELFHLMNQQMNDFTNAK